MTFAQPRPFPATREFSSIITTKFSVNIPLKYSTYRVVINPSDSNRLPGTRQEIEMNAQTSSTFYAPDHGASLPMGQNMTMRPVCAVQLFDRRTGSIHRINGTPLVIFTRNPSAAVKDLFEGRNPENWEARVSETDVGRAP
jgi:hypothetical protein